MNTLTLIQIASGGGAIGFLLAGLAIGRMLRKQPTGGAGAPAPPAGGPAPPAGELAQMQRAGVHLEQQLAKARAEAADAKDRGRALAALNQTAMIGNPPPARAAADPDSLLQSALNSREKELATTRAALARAKEDVAALKEALQGKPALGSTQVMAPSAQSNKDISLMQAALNKLEHELSRARADASRAKEDAMALKQVLAAGGALPSPAPAKPVPPAASADIATLQAALGKMEAELQRSRQQAQSAQENVRALQQALEMKGGAVREAGPGAAANRDEVATLQKAVNHLEQQLDKARVEANDAKERLRALTQATAGRPS